MKLLASLLLIGIVLAQAQTDPTNTDENLKQKDENVNEKPQADNPGEESQEKQPEADEEVNLFASKT